VDEFHRRGVKVFFPPGLGHEHAAGGPAVWTALVEALKEIGADGINFDTLESAPVEFHRAAVAAGHPSPWSRSSPSATSR
jgi:hypothetical protein